MPEKYIISKIDNKQYCKVNGKFLKHLMEHGLTYKDYYEQYVSWITPLCQCLKPLVFYSVNFSYSKTCGSFSCRGKEMSKTIRSWTPAYRDEVCKKKSEYQKNRTPEEQAKRKEKMISTCIERHGVDWKEKQQAKVYATKLLKYGDPHWSNSEKSSMKNQNKTPEEQSLINEKRRKTNIELYGVENTFFKSNDCIKKSARSNNRHKDYMLPSGRIIGIRGYEGRVLAELLKLHDEHDLLIHDAYSEYNIPIFEYITANKHKNKYYPDIYIPKDNLIIEVKGRWWWDGNGAEKYKSRLTNNLNKRKSVINAGYDYQLWLFQTHKTYTVCVTDNEIENI